MHITKTPVFLVLAVALCACSSGANGESDRIDRALEDVAGTEWVITAEVIESRVAVDGYGDKPGSIVRVKEVVAGFGEKLIAGRLRTAPSPSLEKDIVVWTQGFDLAVGNEYVFFLSYMFQNPSGGPEWIAKLVLDQKERMPVSGTDRFTQEHIRDTLLPGEVWEQDWLEAIIAFTAEQSASVQARLQRNEEMVGPRMRQVFDLPDPAIAAQEQLQAWLDTPAERRQLGIEEFDLPEGAGDGLGVTWVRREMMFRYDAVFADEYTDVGLFFPGVGILGPFRLDTEQSALPVFGTAPAHRPVQVVAWIDGKADFEVLGRLTGKNVDELGDEGYFIVDVRDGDFAFEVVSADEYEIAVMQAQPTTAP